MSCMDYASVEELIAFNATYRSFLPRRVIEHDHLPPDMQEEGHESCNEKCWCDPEVVREYRNTYILHRHIVPLNPS